jgi:hypothetical protein
MPTWINRSSIDSLSDEEISALIDGIRDEDAIGFRGGDAGSFQRDSVVHPISHDAVVKFMYGPEPFMMAYVSSNTSTPIPRVRWILHQPSRDFNPWLLDYTPVVIDSVDEELLETAWPKLSWWARLRVIWYIRSYIRRL